MKASKVLLEGAPLLLVFLFYLAGVWMGEHPRVFSKYIRLTKPEITIYISDPQIMTPSLQTVISAKAQLKLNFVTDPENISSAEIWIGEFADLAGREVLTDMKEKKDWDTLFQKVSPDFRLSLFQAKHYLPVLWRLDRGMVRVLGIRRASDKTEYDRELLSVEKVFLSEDFQEEWLQRINWNTTLLKLDDSSIPESRRASAIRKVSLQNVHWAF